MKKFKSKKIKKRKRIHRLIVVFFFVFSYAFMASYASKNRLSKNVLDSKVNIINFSFIRFLSDRANSVINKPVSLLNSNVKNASYTSEKKANVNVKKENVAKIETTKEFKPLIYVYSTHQGESYTDYTVLDAASYLTDKLNANGLDTFFEEQSVSTFLQANNMKYYKSYDVSRKYLDEAKVKYPSISYFFDIHRDAISKEKSTITLGKKSYAKIMFIVGTDNKSYQSNLDNAKKLNDIINEKAPGITRGVMQKGGRGVNGIYNQDTSPNSFLIEVGGNNNSKQEVINSMEVIIQSITEYVRGTIW